jgi:hypothetical protein
MWVFELGLGLAGPQLIHKKAAPLLAKGSGVDPWTWAFN